ncbi:putative bifunctional diguanylate cyclase/phosphodiesterase [Duganella sp. P38]|uniref:putative bifunctional diguanylate cyclase/phosphodiesterase n=1 Tax=Duganella sp. P38 TaxID=3423949 RepID=UPI003D7BE2F0
MADLDDLAHWRAHIFARLLLVVFVLGLLTAVPSALLAASEGLWPIAVVDLVALAWIGLIWRWRALSYRARVAHFITVAYLVGVALLLQVGPVSQIYLMAVPVLAALLWGLRPALLMLVLAGLTVMLLGYRDNASVQLAGLPDYAFLRAAIVAVNFMFMTAVLTLSCAVLLQHLERSFARLSALNAELRLTSAAVARLNDMVLIADAAQRIIFVNHAFERRSGYPRAAVLGQPLRLLRGADTEPAALARIAAAVAARQAVRAELLNYARDGTPYWVELELVPLADAAGAVTHWVAVERDISERRRAQDEIHRLAFYDVLTGLPNRRLLMDRLATLLASSVRGGTHSAVMFVDLDRFKTINDARGHAIGDALLCGAAARLQALMRQADTVARIGGDEFVVLLGHLAPGLDSASHAALTVAEKIRAALAEEMLLDGQAYRCTASIGVTMLPRAGAPAHSAHDLLREADTAMYRAKSHGRNGIAFYEDAMQAALERRLTLERDLAAALAAGALQLHVQAQVDGGGRAVGGELLLRWPQADGSQVAPSVFIPLAEESGLIVALGAWALRQACAAVLQLQAAGLALPLSVNVSPRQFRQPDFVDQVRQALADSGAPAQLLVLEVTEGLLIDRLDDTIARMHQLAALGLRFSIDDFGTGYASLAYLKKMPLYELKIDRSFIVDAPDDASSGALVQSMLAMAARLGLRVVAEGVETQAQADFLIGHGCPCLQGYLYARPQPLAALMAQLKAGGGVLPAGGAAAVLP